MEDKKVIQTEHPYIVKIKGPSGIWQAVIKGTYIRVWALASYYKQGMQDYEILKGFPTITAAQYYDAISYYHDYKDEIEQFIEENEKAAVEYFAKEKELRAEDQAVFE